LNKTDSFLAPVILILFGDKFAFGPKEKAAGKANKSSNVLIVTTDDKAKMEGYEKKK